MPTGGIGEGEATQTQFLDYILSRCESVSCMDLGQNSEKITKTGHYFMHSSKIGCRVAKIGPIARSLQMFV